VAHSMMWGKGAVFFHDVRGVSRLLLLTERVV
jgi:hypothetical protein